MLFLSVVMPSQYKYTLLLDKSTQLESSQISLMQVDLEQIKYKIQPTFLNYMEMQVNRSITYLIFANPLLSLLIQAPEPSNIELQNPVEKVETSKQYLCI